MNDPAKLTFKVQDKTDPEKWTVPRWSEVEVENATCPKCGQTMVVIIGDVLYGFCSRCRKYYIGR
jgi:tRNA(Ile2) C34 agmatinyltransferase TiaS